MSDIW